MRFLKDLKDHFKPEFLNRVDNIVVFRPLTHDNIKQIVEIHVRELQKHIKDKGIVLDLTPDALDRLATLSTDPDYGARPVRRKVQELIEDPLSQGILDEEFGEGDTIQIIKADDRIELKKKAPRSKAGLKKKAEAKSPLQVEEK